VQQVALSARGFYFVMFGLYYTAVVKYPNKLREAFTEDLGSIYPWMFVAIHLASIGLFLTAGRNPGYVDETETPQSRKEKTKMFVGQYDEFRNVTDDNESAAGGP
jgi:hypothetical protein